MIQTRGIEKVTRLVARVEQGDRVFGRIEFEVPKGSSIKVRKTTTTDDYEWVGVDTVKNYEDLLNSVTFKPDNAIVPGDGQCRVLFIAPAGDKRSNRAHVTVRNPASPMMTSSEFWGD